MPVDDGIRHVESPIRRVIPRMLVYWGGLHSRVPFEAKRTILWSPFSSLPTAGVYSRVVLKKQIRRTSDVGFRERKNLA